MDVNFVLDVPKAAPKEPKAKNKNPNPNPNAKPKNEKQPAKTQEKKMTKF